MTCDHLCTTPQAKLIADLLDVRATAPSCRRNGHSSDQRLFHIRNIDRWHCITMSISVEVWAGGVGAGVLMAQPCFQWLEDYKRSVKLKKREAEIREEMEKRKHEYMTPKKHR